MQTSIKRNIQKHFNSAKKTYDQHCFIQYLTCYNLIKFVINLGENYKNIADMACGTGLSTQFLDDYLLFDLCSAIDFSKDLLDVAINKSYHQNINFILNDFDSKNITKHSFDLVFCNMGLQWSLNLNATLAYWKSMLQKNGIIAFSIPLYNSLYEINSNHRNQHLTWLEIHDIINLLKYEIIHSEYLCYSQIFPNQIQALQSIKKVGANYLLPIKQSSDKINTKLISKRTFTTKKNNFQLTYNMGYFIIGI